MGALPVVCVCSRPGRLRFACRFACPMTPSTARSTLTHLVWRLARGLRSGDLSRQPRRSCFRIVRSVTVHYRYYRVPAVLRALGVTD
eukprot:1275528-Prymnesium_polylepis.2